jgi:hypothetical protein
LEDDTGVGVAIAGAGAAVVASFVGCHSHSWRTKHFVLLVVLEEVVVAGHSTEDYIGLLLEVEDEAVVDVQLQQPSKPSNLVGRVGEVEDLEVKEAAAVCN